MITTIDQQAQKFAPFLRGLAKCPDATVDQSGIRIDTESNCYRELLTKRLKKSPDTTDAIIAKTKTVQKTPAAPADAPAERKGCGCAGKTRNSERAKRNERV